MHGAIAAARYLGSKCVAELAHILRCIRLLQLLFGQAPASGTGRQRYKLKPTRIALKRQATRCGVRVCADERITGNDARWR